MDFLDNVIKKVMACVYDQLLIDEAKVNFKYNWEHDFGVHLEDYTWC